MFLAGVRFYLAQRDARRRPAHAIRRYPRSGWSEPAEAPQPEEGSARGVACPSILKRGLEPAGSRKGEVKQRCRTKVTIVSGAAPGVDSWVIVPVHQKLYWSGSCFCVASSVG
jgi:hypothetical protein